MAEHRVIADRDHVVQMNPLDEKFGLKLVRALRPVWIRDAAGKPARFSVDGKALQRHLVSSGVKPDDSSLVSAGKDGVTHVHPNELLASLIRAVQELDDKLRVGAKHPLTPEECAAPAECAEPELDPEEIARLEAAEEEACRAAEEEAQRLAEQAEEAQRLADEKRQQAEEARRLDEERKRLGRERVEARNRARAAAGVH